MAPKFDFHAGADRVASSCAATTRRARSLMRIWRWAIVPSDRSSTRPSPRRLSPPNSVEIVAVVSLLRGGQHLPRDLDAQPLPLPVEVVELLARPVDVEAQRRRRGGICTRPRGCEADAPVARPRRLFFI